MPHAKVASWHNTERICGQNSDGCRIRGDGLSYRYIGVTGLTVAEEVVDLGQGVLLKPTFAHLMAPHIMAFRPADKGKPHPGPWRAARGGLSIDITAELCVPTDDLPFSLTTDDLAWWVLALLRLSYRPYVFAPVVSDVSFTEAATSDLEPTLTPWEIEPPRFGRPADRSAALSEEEQRWLRSNWLGAVQLGAQNPKFMTALEAFDSCRTGRAEAASLLALWGALEQLFAPSAGELRYRVSSNIAAFLEPRGPSRLATFKRLLKLYDRRSTAAHSVADIEEAEFTGSWVVLRNALMKMVVDDHVPNQADFERLQFVEDATSESSKLSWGGLSDGGA